MLPRRALDRRGVSEVIGSILVLLITVTIFSTIVLWVFTLPAPSASGNAGIDGVLEGRYVAGSWAGAFVNLTHLGGDDLVDGNTRVYLTIDGQTHALRTRGTHFDGVPPIKQYGVGGPDAHWNIGETWTYLNETIPTTAQVSVLVVDIVRGTVVWDQVLLGEGGERMPVFLDKWFDSDATTASRDPVKPDDKFTVYAKVIDPDSDLNTQSVWAYLTFGTSGVPIGYVQLVDNGVSALGDKRAGDRIFSRAIGFEAEKGWDGGIIILNATDDGGREAQTRLILRVFNLGGTTLLKGPEGLSFGSDLQRFDIYNETEWVKDRWSAPSTRTFTKGETVVVVVASKYLPNLELKNSFLIYDSYTSPAREIVYSGPPYTTPVTTASVPSSHAAFTFEEFLGGFYVYTYSFSTTSADYGFDGVQMSFGHFPLIIDLKTSIVEPPKNRFWVTDSITVTDQDGVVPDYPQILFFKDPLHTQPSDTFTFTDTLYVVVQVKSTDGTLAIGDVLIQDAIAGIQVWASPGSVPVSSAAINNSGLDSRRYAFSVDLSQPNFDSWLIGLNAYSFRVKYLSDLDEEYVGALSKQVNIQGPRWLMDIMVAMKEFEHPVFDEEIFGYFYRHDANWERIAYELFQSTPQQQDPEFGRGPFHDIAFGDFDGDSDLDAVVGTEDGAVLIYRNTKGDGTKWARIVIDFNAGGKVLGVAAGDVDRDRDPDIAAGTDDGNLWLYKNDGYWTPTLVDSVSDINVVKFGDVTGDGVNDLLVGLRNGRVNIYMNDGTGVFGTTVVTDYMATGESLIIGAQSGSYLDTHAADDVYEGLQESWSTAYSLDERVTDGVFQANLSAWPVEVNTQTQGSTAWDSMTALPDGSGSLRAQNTLGNSQDFTGYRAQVLQTPILPGSPYQLSFFYRKSYIGPAPSVQSQAIVLVYTDGFTEQIWSNSGIKDSAAWVDVRIDSQTATIHGNLTSIRLTYDLRGSGGSPSQAKIWFDGISLQVKTPSGTTSRLEHRWTVAGLGLGGTAYQFKLQAYHTPNVENDDFVLYYSLDDFAYTRMVTVSNTVDDGTYRAFVLPQSVGGQTVYVKAFDTDGLPGDLGNDTLFVDHLFISRITVVTPNVVSINLGSEVHDLASGDLDGDGDLDIVAGTRDGNVNILKNLLGTGLSWGTSSIASSGRVLSVDVGDFDNDGDLDIAAGTRARNLHVYINVDGVGGTWSGTTIESNVGEVLALAAGDVDGDFWDDIVIATEVGNVYYYQNNHAGGWTRTQIDFIEEPVFGVAIGDVDMGVVG